MVQREIQQQCTLLFGTLYEIKRSRVCRGEVQNPYDLVTRAVHPVDKRKGLNFEAISSPSTFDDGKQTETTTT